MVKFLKQAVPSGLSMLVENLQFMLVTVWAGHFGETSLAAHSAMLDIFTVLTAGMYGLGDACTVRVANELGRGDFVGARKVAKLTFFSMIGTGVVVGVLFFVVADDIGSAFSNDSDVQVGVWGEIAWRPTPLDHATPPRPPLSALPRTLAASWAAST